MTTKEIYDPKLDEMIYEIKHPSGLKIFVYPKKDYTKKFAYFATKYGALYNEFINEKNEKIQLPFGIAHFLEHKIFEDETKDIFADFAKLGANVNAYTNFASTVYYFSTVNHFKPALKSLIDFVLTPHITHENVEKEKGIIVQEIKMYDDDPNWRVYFNGLSALYENHPIREDIAGSEESVNASTVDDLMTAYNTFYSPKNMVLFLIGDFDKDEMENEVLDLLPEEYLNKNEFGKIVLNDEREDVCQEYVSLKMDVPMPLFNLFIKSEKAELNDAYFRKSMVNRIALDYLFGKSSDFYNSNYEEGLINSTFGSEYSYGQEYSYYVFGGESTQPELMKEKVIEAIALFNQEGIEEKSFLRIKRKMIGRYISSFNSIQYTANTFSNYYLKGINLFDFLSIVESITIEDVNHILEIEIKEKMTLSVVV